MNIKHCVALLFFFISLRESGAQRSFEKAKFSRIEVSAGLSNSNVTSILQDSRGFLWVGTADGLNRYDGYNFRVYRNSQDTSSLLLNSISCIFEDRTKKLWVSTRGGGLHYYSYNLDKFIRIPQFSSNCQILQITEDDKDDLWITGTRYYDAFVGRLNRVTGRWEEFRLFPSKNPVMSIVRQSDTEYWVGLARGGLHHWNIATNAVENYSPSENHPADPRNDISKVLKDKKGNLLIATTGGLFELEIKSRKITPFTGVPSHPHAFISYPAKDILFDDDDLWVGTFNGGLYQINTATGVVHNFMFDKNDPFSLSDNSVWSLHKDRQNRIWVGTFSKGLCVIDKLQNKFGQLDIVLENDIVNAIFEDSKNRVWIGTEGGIARKDGATIKYYRHEPGKPGSLSSNPVLSFYEDSRHRIWVGTWAGGVNRYDETTDRFLHFQHEENNPSSLSDDNVYSINENPKTHQLLASSYKGLNVLVDEQKGIFERIKDPDSVSYSESNSYIRTIYVDHTGAIWLGTVQELVRYLPEENKIIRFDARTTGGDMRKNEIVNCILQDKKERLWVAATEGLMLIVNNKAVKRFTVKDGLLNNIVSGILEDESGNLWLSTTQGLCRFNPDKNTFQNYNTADGLISNEFKPNACFKNKQGLFFFGGKGVNVFDPNTIQQNPYAPPVYITDFKIFNKSLVIGGKDSLLHQQITETTGIQLPYNYNFFSLEFAALNFSSSNKNQYAYQLEGFDDEWVYLGNQRTATFTNLNPGTYTFRVKASNNDGVWNNTGATLVIHILPPIWKTWWFRTLVILLFVIAAIAYYRTRIGAITRRNRKLEAMVSERTHELVLRDAEIIHRNEELATQNRELQAARQIIENGEVPDSKEF
jgi:ligand-binding sensor domain-containing protein